MKTKRIVTMLGAALTVLFLAGSCNQPFGQFLTNRTLLSFNLTSAVNSGLSADCTGIIGTGTVSLNVPAGTDVSALIPSFTFLGQELRVGTEVQTSGVTYQNFTSPVVYTLVAWSGEETEYTVSVLVAVPPVTIPTNPWAKTLSSCPVASEAVFTDVAVDSAGNVYAVGYQNEQDGSTYGYEDGITADGPNSNINAVIVKYSSAGTTLWAKTIESAIGHSGFNAVAVDTIGNAYAAGYQNGTGKFFYGDGVSATGACSGNNVALVKYGSNGTVLWARTAAGTSVTDAAYNDITLDADGNIYAGGYQLGKQITYEYGGTASAAGESSSTNVVIVKYDSSGNGLWAASTFTGPSPSPDAGESIFESVRIVDSGTVYAAGYQGVPGSSNGTTFYYASNAAASAGVDGRKNGMLVAYDGATGTAQWAKAIGHSTTDGDSYFRGVYEADGSLYVVGDLKVDSAYTVNYDFGNSVIVQGSNGLDIESGHSYAILVKYNSSGLAQWARYPSPGPSDSSFRSVTVDPSGIIHAAGYQSLNGVYTYGAGITASGGGESTNNAILVSYNAGGTALEALSVSCNQSGLSEYATVASDTGGNVYAAGSIYGSMGPLTYSYPTFSGDPVEATGANENGPNIVLVKYGPMP